MIQSAPFVKASSRLVDKCAKFVLDVLNYPQNVILCWPLDSRAQQPGVMNTPSVSGSSAFSRQPRVRVSSPADVLAVVPHLLGFHPSNSLVVMGVGRPRARVQLAFRYDLPDPPDDVHAADIAEHAAEVLRHRRLSTVIGVGYGPGARVTPVADALAAALRQTGLRLHELMRVEDGRYWSYLCENPECCPADGVPFDVRANPAAAAMTVAGLVAYPDRAALAGTLAPVTGAAARSMEEATSRARERAADLIAQASSSAGPDAGQGAKLLVDAGRRAVQEAISTYRAGGRVLADEPVAWLTVVLAHLAVRDDAWARMDPGYRAAHLRLWTDVVRRAAPAYLPAPASLLAFTAWQSGEGALANIAIDRALAADPAYSLARLLRDIMDAGVPPSAARVPMTPEQVAASYDLAERVPERTGGRVKPGRGRKPARKQPSP
jgi:Domain of unknown function (DUF4192)